MSEQQQTLTIQQAIDLALQDHNAGRLSEAENIYQQILKSHPNQPVALHMLGVIANQMGTHDAAADLIARSLALKPNLAEAHSNLGIALKGLGKLEDAVASYRKALALKPDLAEAHSNLGLVLQDLGMLEDAVACYHKALALKPDYTDAYYNLGNALKDQGKQEEAVASYGKALALKPDYAEAHNNLGNALWDIGKSDEAVVSYHKALALKPNYAEAHFNLHGLLLDPNDLAPSINCMEKAVELDQLNTNYRFILGMLWDYSGDAQKATTHFGMVENGENLYQARLDAWRYIKTANNKVPSIIGDSIRVFKLGIDAAVVDGLVLEFGVRFGTSIRQIAALIDQDIHGFDSFEGLPEAWYSNPIGSYSTKGVIPAVPEKVTLHKGWFEKTLPGFIKKYPEPVRFMNIDCDIYSSTKTVLELLHKRIIPGTVIVFDEYIGNENWREDEFKAFQEAVLKYGWEYEYLCFSFMSKQVVVRIK